MRTSGKPTAQLDIILTDEKYKNSPQNPMDLTTDSGFLLLGKTSKPCFPLHPLLVLNLEVYDMISMISRLVI